MIQRIDYWRGFTGGFLAGVAIGTLIYLSQDLTNKITEEDADFFAAESAGPSGVPAEVEEFQLPVRKRA